MVVQVKQPPRPPSPMALRLNGTGIAIDFLLVVSGGVALVITDLVRVVDDDDTGTGSTCGKKLNSLRDRIANGIPLTSIKIVLVAWQIVSQVKELGSFECHTSFNAIRCRALDDGRFCLGLKRDMCSGV